MKQELLKTKFVDNQTKEKIILTDVSWEEKKMVIMSSSKTELIVIQYSGTKKWLLSITEVQASRYRWRVVSKGDFCTFLMLNLTWKSEGCVPHSVESVIVLRYGHHLHPPVHCSLHHKFECHVQLSIA
jgi:hypothetical protein